MALSFCWVIILLHSSSQAHKVAHASLGIRFGQHSASFHRSHWKCYWYIFPKMGTFGTVWGLDIFFFFIFSFQISNNRYLHMNSVQENDRGWYMCQVRSIQSGFFLWNLKSIIMITPSPQINTDPMVHRLVRKNHFSQWETNGHGLTAGNLTIWDFLGMSESEIEWMENT